jgi:SAM-dependent MidA family methyltransferase
VTLIERIHERGPLTVAAFMDLALYDPEFGYYARAARRSGRAGDFFTSVDVGLLFGDLLEIQIDEMASLLTRGEPAGCDLVEAGAGSGRLSADILRVARARHPALYERLRLHLVEASPCARSAQLAILGPAADRLASSSDALPESYEGVLVANELLDAMPVHQVVMRRDGLREVYVIADGSAGGLRAVEGPPSTIALAEYLARAGVELEPGWRAEISLRAVDWVREASRRLRRGFLILIDYGHEARELYSASHAGGTLTTFARHRAGGRRHPTLAVEPGRAGHHRARRFHLRAGRGRR